jgi:hypothetical protein
MPSAVVIYSGGRSYSVRGLRFVRDQPKQIDDLELILKFKRSPAFDVQMLDHRVIRESVTVEVDQQENNDDLLYHVNVEELKVLEQKEEPVKKSTRKRATRKKAKTS